MTETQTKQKPSFRETRRGITMDLDDVGLQFNSDRVGPNNFIGLRKADYGEGFKMPTAGQVSHLVYASLENRDYYKSAKDVVDTVRKRWITGDTALLWTPSGVYAQDHPKIENGRVSIRASMNEKKLKNKLGSREENSVVYSEDGNVRFTPCGFQTGRQSSSQLANNAGIVAIFGTLVEAEAIARSSEHYESQPWFGAFNKGDINEPLVRVPNLFLVDFGNRLGISGSGWKSLDEEGFSFGVRESGKATRAKK